MSILMCFDVFVNLAPTTVSGGEFDWTIHLSKGNASVLRPAQRGQKRRVEGK